jgi:hypothetical protein
MPISATLAGQKTKPKIPEVPDGAVVGISIPDCGSGFFPRAVVGFEPLGYGKHRLCGGAVNSGTPKKTALAARCVKAFETFSRR